MTTATPELEERIALVESFLFGSPPESDPENDEDCDCELCSNFLEASPLEVFEETAAQHVAGAVFDGLIQALDSLILISSQGTDQHAAVSASEVLLDFYLSLSALAE